MSAAEQRQRTSTPVVRRYSFDDEPDIIEIGDGDDSVCFEIDEARSVVEELLRCLGEAAGDR